MKSLHSFATGWRLLCAVLLSSTSVLANVPGGGTNGANVTLVDNGTSVTMANGIVSILCTKAGATVDQINYTYNNGSGTQTINLLSGGNNGGQLYWELGGFGTGGFTYTLVASPTNTAGNYAEISLLSTSPNNGTMEVHFSMLRGSTGFYVTAIWSHRAVDAAMGMGETRDNIYAGTIFNWMSVDANRNRLMEVSGGSANGVIGAPVEVSLWTTGIYAGQYEDKYKYSADFGSQRVWGWSSVGAGGKNVGLWNVSGSVEYYSGGPMKRELMEHIGTTILNMHNGGHYGGGSDGNWGAGEVWTKVYGPYFIYCNNITNAITATNQAAQTLYADAIAQAAAEGSAWPYYWFTNANYTPAANRGTVTGQIAINDSYNPNASASNLWVGVVQQPITTDAVYDFQKWDKPYQFWTKSDANGNFVISNVIAGGNYTLYAFGQGAAGTFQSQPQSGGSTPNSINIPSPSFSVMVTGGLTNNLGTITWTPTRVGPTVFEIGYPDRTAAKFRHGEDWWVGDIGPNAANPSPVWSKWLEYPFDFSSEPSYTVGQSRWTTDWNFVQPVVTDNNGNYNGSTSTIKFNLASPPAAMASLYLAIASSYQGPLNIKVNGTAIAGANGYDPAYDSSSQESDATIREGIHGLYSDNRITFSGSLLHTNQNTITINMRKGGYFANHSMYDYIRLEMPGYVPPATTNVVAYAGNNCNLICWPVIPGATSYNILRTTTSGSGYVPITNGVTGPVCGSGLENATWLDTTAINGTAYYYVVQSVNPVGVSTNSPESLAATPDPGISASAPVTPTGLTVGGTGHQSVTLNWNGSPGANYYTIYRSTLVNNGGGASNVLNTIVLDNTTTTASFIDNSPTDGSIYSYSVTATSTGGTSGNSAPAVAVPLPSPPASAPGSLVPSFVQPTNMTISWAAVPGAVGYVVSRAASPGGPFTFLMSVTETSYFDSPLNPATTYYYRVTAVNAAGVSANATLTAVTPPGAPFSLSAVPGDSQVTLSWPAVAGVTSYIINQGTSPGSENTTIISGYSGTTYTNTGLADGTTYYYVVAATDAGGTGPNSPEASATPGVNIVVNARNLVWKGDGSGNQWNVSGTPNWLSNTVATTFNDGDSATFNNVGSNNVAVTLAGLVQPALLTVAATKNYTFNGPGLITGSNVFLKGSSGTLTINSTNSFTGGTIVSNGLIVEGNAGANLAGLGSGSVTFYGGTLEFNGYTGSTTPDYLGNTNPLIIPLGFTGTLHVPQRWATPGLAGTLSGSGTLELYVTYVRGDISGNWTNFHGHINVRTPGTGDFRVLNANGFPNAKLYVGTNVFMYSRAAGGSVIPIGEFTGAPNAGIAAGGGSSVGTQNAVTWRVGGLNTDATNAGIFQGTTALIKEGTGAWTLTGASTQTGATTISNGTVWVNGSFSGSPVTVSGGTLGGTGVISGAPVVVNLGSLAPGNPFGVLTISNNLTLSGNSTTTFQVQHSPLANSAVKVSGTIIAGGTLNVTDTGSGTLDNGDSFQLFTAGNAPSGFTNIILPPLTGSLVWNTNTLKASGAISVVTLTSPIIGGLQVSGANLVISGTGGVNSWPYYVLSCTNLVNAQWSPVATNQFDAAGNFSLAIPNAFNASQPQTFYQLQLQ